MTDRQDRRSQRVSATMFMIAGVVFLLTAILGGADPEIAFLILAMVFVVLSLNTWQTSRTTSGDSSDIEDSDSG